MTNQSTAQKQISALPAECYGVLLVDNSLIKIVAGETGYRPIDSISVKKGMLVYDANTMSEFADKLNAEDGISKAQRKAMEHGSMFGWETLGANAAMWENNPKFK